jgi:hypothetical protein
VWWVGGGGGGLRLNLVIAFGLAKYFHKFNSTPVYILLQSENISVTNGRMVATFCMSDPTLFVFILSDESL